MRTELSILFREKKTKEFKESWRKKLEKIEVKELQDYSLSIFNFCNMVIKKAVEKGEKKGKGKNYTFSQNLFYLLLIKVLFKCSFCHSYSLPSGSDGKDSACIA